MEILNFKGLLSDLIHILKKGGSIHIKKKNRGKFTKSAKRAGMGVQEYARHVLANKDKYSSTLVKRANFARNAKKFKHENGGVLFAQNGAGNWWTPQPLSPVDIALNQVRTRTKLNNASEPLPPGVKETIGPDGQKITIRTEQPLQPIGQKVAAWLPGVGDIVEVGQIANDVKNGNLGTAALAAGLITLPGNAGKLIHKTRKLPTPDYFRPTYSQGKVKDLIGFVEQSGVDKLSDETYRELLDLIELSQHSKNISSRLTSVSKKITDELYQATLPKSKPLNRWQQPFDEMIPMENFGHRRKTTDNFKLSDYYENGGILKTQEGIRTGSNLKKTE